MKYKIHLWPKIQLNSAAARLTTLLAPNVYS